MVVWGWNHEGDTEDTECPVTVTLDLGVRCSALSPSGLGDVPKGLGLL